MFRQFSPFLPKSIVFKNGDFLAARQEEARRNGLRFFTNEISKSY